MSHQSDEIRDVTYVAVPYSDYKKFLTLQQENKRLQEQLHKHLQYKPIIAARREEPESEEASKSPDNNDVGEVTVESKSGAGQVAASASGPSFSPEVIQTIVSMVLQQLPGVSATGKGASDLVPQPPGALPLTTIDPSTAKVVNEGNDEAALNDGEGENEQTDKNINEVTSDDLESKLIETVRSGDKDKASKLLRELKNHSGDLHFNSDGKIFIDGEALEGANIFDLFNHLFKPSHYAHHPHLQTLVNEISSLGLGYLISRFYSVGLSPKGRNIITNRHQLHQELKSRSKPWYHVGQPSSN